MKKATFLKVLRLLRLVELLARLLERFLQGLIKKLSNTSDRVSGFLMALENLRQKEDEP